MAIGFLQSLFEIDVRDLFSDWKKESAGIYFVDESTQRKFGITESCLEAILSEKEAPMSVREAAHVVNRRLGFRATLKWLRRCAEVSKTIGVDKTGSVSLRRWNVFAPKTVSEMAQRALMEIGKPAHIKEILKKMNVLFPKRAPFSEGSVHTMLWSEEEIFIPARRGVYGLSSWKIRRAPKIRDFLVEAIKQNGGTARVEDLIAEGSAKYGFRTSSVRNVLRDKATFVQVSSEGIVKLVP